ncbi:uncharacterized protein LOC132602085 isoform X2 [Lycium barbarum]|uniref:uncharacterized protein LOC132602085 isoform X2 n=1 Tax=Lycium barbarum TaxID=112863 RepID=UPI00293ECBAD|nr:uncharacterized protein LOC132602085 isoform X2 [Lycium barbarum]
MVSVSPDKVHYSGVRKMPWERTRKDHDIFYSSQTNVPCCDLFSYLLTTGKHIEVPTKCGTHSCIKDQGQRRWHGCKTPVACEREELKSPSNSVICQEYIWV